MKKELAQLEQEESRLRKLNEKALLRQKLEEKRAKVKKLQSLSISKHINVPDISVSSSKLTLNDLRQSKPLKKIVKKENQALGLHETSESDTDSDSSCSSDSTTSSGEEETESMQVGTVIVKKNKKKRKHKKHSKKSGIAIKSSDKVKNRQKYPHSQWNVC
ncbi:protein FAM133-like [Mercenaria mercenaria]|uniref:protein FAM133-like n=1 Tax=Mercenaria mercenaria TaxID=6596 RepID=UPI00234F9DFE|nr:protein FAM133-like [Mercenaria mercenaria]